MKVKQPENLTLDKIKNEFSKPFYPPTKTEFERDKKWAIKLAFNVVAPQRTNKTKSQTKVCIKGIL